MEQKRTQDAKKLRLPKNFWPKQTAKSLLGCFWWFLVVVMVVCCCCCCWFGFVFFFFLFSSLQRINLGT